MKVIVITDIESLMLLDRLELAKLKEAGHYRNTETSHEAMAEAHRVFHYEVTMWLLEMGAKVAR